MKKIFVASIVLTGLFFAGPVSADAQIPDHTDRFYINDFADILTDETENHIFETSKKLDEGTSAQIVVTTINNLDGRDIESYATDMFRQWGIGDNEKNSGLLLLVSKEDRKLRIEVGYGLEGILPDGKAGRIRDEHITPSLKDDKWDEGIINGYNALFAVVDENRDEIGKDPPVMSGDDMISLIIVLIVFGGIGLLIWLAHKHPEWADSGRNGRNGTTGGFFGSSSGSGGGGGGGFSGGGGSSGGGGASGSF